MAVQRMGRIVWRLCWAAGEKNLSHIAAGVAFYMLFSIFPAIAMVISVVGLVADPSEAAGMIAGLETLLPPDAFMLVDAQLQNTLAAGSLTLGSTAAVSLALSFWAAGAAIRGMMTALHIAFPEVINSSVIFYYLASFFFTLMGIALAAGVVLVWVAAPIAVQTLIVMAQQVDSSFTLGPATIQLLEVPVLLLIGVATLTGVYRAGAARGRRPWRAAAIAATAATLLWIAASKLLTIYVTQFGDFAKTYGPVGAVAALMLWFWITAFVLLLGAELASILSRGEFARRDAGSNSGPKNERRMSSPTIGGRGEGGAKSSAVEDRRLSARAASALA